MTEDEDIDAPTIEELKTLATLLWDFHPRTRLKGKIGEALRELSEIRDQIDNGSLSATERVRLEALRAAIEEARKEGKFGEVETESQIKRLRRKAGRLGLLTG
jgi:hypothetical protein